MTLAPLLARGALFIERGFRVFFGVLAVFSPSSDVANEDLAVLEEPRAGAGGRAPEATSAASLAASRLIMRKRPSIASYVAPGVGW